MSYSFSVEEANKTEALQAIEKQIAKIALPRTIHERDKHVVLSNAKAVMSLLTDDPLKNIGVTCYGSLSFEGKEDADKVVITAAEAHTKALHVERKVAEKPEPVEPAEPPAPTPSPPPTPNA
jgi:hypothetical protein